MVLMPAVVFTLLHAVETKPLPFGSIFFVALLVTFVSPSTTSAGCDR